MQVEFVVLISAGVMACGAVLGHFAFNSLLREFASHEPELWHHAGQPSGLFAAPRGRTWNSSSQLLVDWATKTPGWIAAESNAARLLFAVRAGTTLMLLGVLGLVGALVFS